MQPNNLQDALRQASEREQKRVAAEIADTQLRIVTGAFDKAIAYTNLMIIGGYAGVFGIWQLAKEHLTKEQTLWSALLVLISLTTFIVFEVVKMVFISRALQAKSKVLNSPQARRTPEQLLKQLQDLEATQQIGSTRFHVYWAITVMVAIATALAGVAILGYAFVSGLLR